ncbi:MAG: PQQ-binding-like beta-propeller repeat protein [Planctomycetes bacterium]|nr:PQQ-binding-like beta-propeller repeat protein [Planctomycetota bacterium]
MFRLRFLFALAGFLSAAVSSAGDWPMWRCDAGRTGVCREVLPRKLHLQWVRELPEPRPAWSDPRLAFDRVSHPVVYGKRLFLGSSHDDTVVALDTETGEQRWRFHTDGPVRLSPAVADGRVYVTSDDGHLYCLAAESGELLWRFQGAPSKQKVLGNERLISMWSARGGPVLADGRVYFAAGVWPFMGVFVYALDAETGAVVWSNDRAGVLHTNRKYDQYKQYWGASPQGSLAVSADRLLVPSCRSQPLWLDSATGEILRAEAGWKDYAGGGDSRIAVSGGYLFVGGHMFDIDQMRGIALNSSQKVLEPCPILRLLDRDVLYLPNTTGIDAHDMRGAEAKPYTGNYGCRLARCDTKLLWTVACPSGIGDMIKAGERLYVGCEGKVLAVETEEPGNTGRIGWEADIDGTPGGMAVADSKLFVSTREGRLYCFAGAATEAKIWTRGTATDGLGAAAWREQATSILQETRSTEGYCYVLGLKDGGLVEEVVARSALHVVGVDEDAGVVQRLRGRLRAAGVLGSRAAVHVADPADFGFPPYVASLIVSEDLASVETQEGTSFFEATFEALRPYGGTACFVVPEEHRAEVATGLAAARLRGSDVRRTGALTLINRRGPLPDAADWSHEAAGPGNTWMSRDALVKAPLGVLWFGGPAEKDELYRTSRHSDPPTARVVDGRLFLYGNDTITAVDAYTGRFLWKRGMPPARALLNERAFVRAGPFPGPRGNAPAEASYVAHHDALYIAYGQKLLVWDPATGKTLREHDVDRPDGVSRKLYFGDLKLWGDVLVAGAEFSTEDVESVFLPSDFSDCSAEETTGLRRSIDSWAPIADFAKSADEDDVAFIVRCFNALLEQEALDEFVPAQFLRATDGNDQGAKAVQAAVTELRQYRARSKHAFTPYLSTASFNRRLLEACYHSVSKNPPKLYWHNLYPWDGEYTQRIVGIDRRNGNVLWQQRARYSFPQKSIVVGNEKVFCIDRRDLDVEEYLARRGIPQTNRSAVKAFDVRTGEPLWVADENVHGYHLMYSAEHDVVIQPSTHDPDPSAWSRRKRTQWVRLIAYRGNDGKILWDKKLELERSAGRHRMWYNWCLHRNTIIVESYYDTHADFYGFDLLTGERRTRNSPLTGTELPWGFRRRGGCTKNLSCENLVLFRSDTAGYYDLAADAGTVNLGGFRTGCKNSLIPADGILSAPNYASGCSCNFPVFTALALTHMPEVECWTTSTYPYDGAPVKRVGINLGAPGDRRAASGTLWLDYPSIGGLSPDIPVEVTPEKPTWLYRHSSRIKAGPEKWVVASGVEGCETVRLTLHGENEGREAGSANTHTVRLYFAEPTAKKPGERVFSVMLQGKEVLTDFDIFRETGSTGVGVVKEFRGVSADRILTLKLSPKAGDTLLCGIEVVRE